MQLRSPGAGQGKQEAASSDHRRAPSWRDLLVHLRLHFQLLLAPIFLWGLFLAGGHIAPMSILAFVIFHVFLYGGATAFNSAYDRDQGPVGGLKRPPPVDDRLLPFSVATLLLGWVLIACLGPLLAAVYGGILVLAVAYSHPAIRLKAQPRASLATIFLGQGVLGYLAGWLSAEVSVAGLLSRESLLGGLATGLIVTGFYPLTQLFQLEEDKRRGDRTLAVAWGPAYCFRFSQCAFSFGGIAVLTIVVPRYGAAEAALAGLFFAVLLSAVEGWRRTFQPSAIMSNFRTAMRLNSAAALALAGYALWRLALGS